MLALLSFFNNFEFNAIKNDSVHDSISSCNSQMTILQYLHKANQCVAVNTGASLILCIFFFMWSVAKRFPSVM